MSKFTSEPEKSLTQLPFAPCATSKVKPSDLTVRYWLDDVS